MPVLLTKKEEEILMKAKAFGAASLAPQAGDWEADGRLPQTARRLQQQGYFGLGCPPELGGGGCNYLETALAYEGLAYGDGGMAFFIQLHNNIVFELATFYKISDKVRSLLPALVRGDKLACFALTDRYGGTDKGMVMLLVERGMPGFTAGENRRSIGGNAMSCGRLEFEDVVVPRENLLSREGMREALRAIDVARIFVPAIAVGVAQRALDITADHLARRQTFGRPILDNHAVGWRLAELTALVQAARWTVYHTASLADAGGPVSYQAAINKYCGPEAALRVCTECAQLFGAEGCQWNSEIIRCVNMARLFKIMDGTSEVQRKVVARTIQREARARCGG